jgi:hypothetical protein
VSANEFIEGLIILAPGFLLLKLVYLFGGQHRRLEWEWAVWSAMLGVALSALASVIIGIADLSGVAGPVPRPAAQTSLAFALAIVFGLGLAYVWRRLGRTSNPEARKLRRFIADSAWDFVLDEAAANGRGVEVTLTIADKEVSYFGSLHTYGQEVSAVEPWIYLEHVFRWDQTTDAYKPMSERTVGMLFHRDHIVRLRFIEPT